jgi:hypothetical protein
MIGSRRGMDGSGVRGGPDTAEQIALDVVRGQAGQPREHLA